MNLFYLLSSIFKNINYKIIKKFNIIEYKMTTKKPTPFTKDIFSNYDEQKKVSFHICSYSIRTSPYNNSKNIKFFYFLLITYNNNHYFMCYEISYLVIGL